MSDRADTEAAFPALSAEHRGYIARETLVSLVINVLLSLVFALIVSHGVARLPLLGPRGMAVDFLPQSFMITFATTLAVTLLTRQRLRGGKVASLDPWHARLLSRAPKNPLLRAVVFGLVVALVAAPLSAAALYLLGVGSLAQGAFLLMKVAYGAGLTLAITPPIARAALTGR